MSKRQIFIVLGLVVLVAAGAAAWFFLGSSNDAVTAAAAGGTPGFTLTSRDRTIGDPKAKVVMIEYAAPICPHCAAFNAEVIPLLKQKYVDTGKVLYVFRVFPLSADDGAAEKLARCMPEDKYFPFIDLLFRNQPKWDPEYAQETPALGTPQGVHDGLVQLARIAGMSADQADKCMNDTSLDTTINQVAQDGQQKYGITGTPTIVVDGAAQPSGDVPWPKLQQLIDTALAKK